ILVRENFLDQRPDVGLVVHHQHMCRAHALSLRFSMRLGDMAINASRADSLSGNRMRIIAPPCGRFSASMVPACSSTSFFTIASPSPVPRGFVVTYGSKIWPM